MCFSARLNKDEIKCIDSVFVKSGIPGVDLSYSENETGLTVPDLCPT